MFFDKALGTSDATGPHNLGVFPEKDKADTGSAFSSASRAQLREDLATASLSCLCAPEPHESHLGAVDPLAGIIWGRFCYKNDMVNTTRFRESSEREVAPPDYLADVSLMSIPRLPTMHSQEDDSLVRIDTNAVLSKWDLEDRRRGPETATCVGRQRATIFFYLIIMLAVVYCSRAILDDWEGSFFPLLLNLLPGWLLQKKYFGLCHKHPLCKTGFVLLCLWSVWSLTAWFFPTTLNLVSYYPSKPVTVLLSVETPRMTSRHIQARQVGGRYGAMTGKKPSRVARTRSKRIPHRVSFTKTVENDLADEAKIIPLPGAGSAKTDLKRMRTDLVLDKLASSSRKIFDNQLQHWFIFCRIRNREPLWRDNSPCLDSENLVLDYVVQSGIIDNKAPATVKVRLAAIRSHHLSLGLPDPFYHMPRLSMALAGLSRRYGRPERRLPVTTQMLAWLRSELIPEKHADLAVLWAALALGFFFLLRASEYLKPSHHTPKNRGLLGCHVTLCANGSPVTLDTFRTADEVRIEVQGSKTDIYNRGEYRNHFANFDISHGTRLCVVEALIILCSHYPSKFFGSDADSFLLTDSRGEQISREEMQSVLKIAAEKTGAEMGDYGSHSLRFGGASALWAAFHDTGLVKRWGRWATDTFHTYLWEDRKGSEGIAEAMARSDVTPA